MRSAGSSSAKDCEADQFWPDLFKSESVASPMQTRIWTSTTETFVSSIVQMLIPSSSSEERRCRIRSDRQSIWMIDDNVSNFLRISSSTAAWMWFCFNRSLIRTEWITGLLCWGHLGGESNQHMRKRVQCLMQEFVWGGIFDFLQRPRVLVLNEKIFVTTGLRTPKKLCGQLIKNL